MSDHDDDRTIDPNGTDAVDLTAGQPAPDDIADAAASPMWDEERSAEDEPVDAVEEDPATDEASADGTAPEATPEDEAAVVEAAEDAIDPDPAVLEAVATEAPGAEPASADESPSADAVPAEDVPTPQTAPVEEAPAAVAASDEESADRPGQADQPAPTRSRRRRAASRPAGPPVVNPESTVPAAEVPSSPAAETPRTKVAAESPSATAATERVVYPDGAVVVRGGSASQASAATAAIPGDGPAPVAVEEPAQAPADESAAAPDASTSRPSRRRRSASRRQGPPEAPAVAAKSSTGSKSSAVSAPPTSVDVGEASEAPDPIAEAVARQGRSTGRGRRRALAPEERDQALSNIVAALAGGPEQREAAAAPASDDDEQAEPTRSGASGQSATRRSADTREPDADESDDESDELTDEDSESGEGGARRRRRRRGGRRRRRGSDTGEDSESDGGQDAEESENESEPEPESDQDAEASGSEQGDGNRRRRRRRRRRGEDTGGAEDDPHDVVVRVREPRAPKAPSDEITGIEGSTRMEAKRQRRKDGRAAGRARRPILSEAEFLSRREAVSRRLLIRQRDDYTQLAVLEDNVLVEHYVDRESATSLIGNVYLGRVQNVLPSMEAVFIDIGRGRNAVLYAGEVAWESYAAEGEARRVEQVFKSGQTVLVQVTKDPVGAKGSRLTNHVSIPGRYVVYSPGGHLSGISRKLADTERHRLRDILGDLVGDDASVIVRTAAEGASEEELVRDVNRLKAQWEAIDKKAKQGTAPQLLYAEPDLTVRIVRDLFTEDFSELVVSGDGSADDAFDTIEAYVSHVAPHLRERVKRWDAEADGDLFAKHRIDEQIAKALERKVFLPSGGSLVIDRTEAMTVIDVNTGKFTGSGGNLETTITSNNLEAAEEIVRQLRLRDIGGIIVIDFIDMVLPNNRELLLRRLVECLGRDRTRHQVAEVTSLGLVQMTRKRIGTGLAEAFTEPCECCGARGYVRHDEPVTSQAPADGGERRSARRGARRKPSGAASS
ncbi:MAG: Rne/Rng family ribonuclease [Propionibacterium sp.]|nr:Rne/Rng family ribonuclease [Propionibacterium sp.]